MGIMEHLCFRLETTIFQVENRKENYYASAEELAEETKDGKYGDGYIRRVVLDDRWQEVQDIINGVGTDTEYYTVEPGDTLSDIAAKYDTTYQKIAELNDIENPNLIYPGTLLRVR